MDDSPSEYRGNDLIDTARTSATPNIGSNKTVLWKLYLSHTLSTWNARTFEFGAVIFLAVIFPGTLFYTSCYALFRSAAATILSSWIGGLVDLRNRLFIVRQSIIWQRCAVAASCAVLLVLLKGATDELLSILLFFVSVVLACLEKLAFIGNTVAVERDWIVVISKSAGIERQELNSVMRRIDLVCKLVAPLCISLVDGYSTKVALWVVFGQNAISVLFEYFAIIQVYSAVPELAQGKQEKHAVTPTEIPLEDPHQESIVNNRRTAFARKCSVFMFDNLRPFKEYVQNPAFLASFALSLLYLTVLSFASQMVTYLLTLGFTSTHVSIMRLVSVLLELSATCAAPALMTKIGVVRSGLWFVNEQLLSIALAVSLFSVFTPQTRMAGGALIVGVALSRLGLWGFDLCVQYVVQEDAPEATRGSFSAVEMALQNLFELASYATTMVFYKPEQFKYPVYISAGAIACSAACFAAFVRQKRGHLLHVSKCLRRERRPRYRVLPTIEEEEETEMDMVESSTEANNY